MNAIYYPRAGDVPDVALAEFIKAEATELRLAIFSLTNPTIHDAIIDRKRAGVALRLIVDRYESTSDPTQTKCLQTLQAAGVPVRANHHSGLMHLKLAVAGTHSVALGSFNWTMAAENTNDEVLAVIDDPAWAQRSADVFDAMWSDPKRFYDWTPPTPADMRLMIFKPPEF